MASAGSAAMMSRALASAASLLGTAPEVTSAAPFVAAEGAAEMDTEASASPFLSVPATASARTRWRPRLAEKTTAEVLRDEALRP